MKKKILLFAVTITVCSVTFAQVNMTETSTNSILELTGTTQAVSGKVPLRLSPIANADLPTTPPNGALEFDGDHFYGTISGTRYILDQSSLSDDYWYKGGNDFGGNGILGVTGAGNNILFKTNGSERARITDAGYVYINRTTDNGDGDELQMDGTAYINGAVRVANITPLTNGGLLYFGQGLTDWDIHFRTNSKTPVKFSADAPNDAFVLGGTALTIGHNIVCTNTGNNLGTILGRYITTTEAIVAGQDILTSGFTTKPVRPGEPYGTANNCNNCTGLDMYLWGGRGTGSGNGGKILFQVKSADGASAQAKSVMSTAMFVTPTTGNVGIGIGLSSAAAQLHILNTSEQLRVAYDASNYCSTTVGSAGGVTFDAIGTTPMFTFNDDLYTNNIFPLADNTYDLGSGSAYWKDLYLAGTIYTSDERLKTNIEDLDYDLYDLLKLRPVSYHWIKEDDGKRLGLLAQEVDKVIPEIVEYDEESDRWGVRYTELIPIIIKSVQEQQKQIANVSGIVANVNDKTITEKLNNLETQLAAKDAKLNELQDKLVALEAKLDMCCAANNKTNGTTDGGSKGIVSTLDQNVPNPFNGETTIGFNIVTDYSNAFLGIYDLNGQEMRTIAIAKDMHEIIITKGMLKAGMYTYSLVVDGNLIDAKKMVVID